MNKPSRKFYAAIILFIFLGGCATEVGVRSINEDLWFRRSQRNALTQNAASQYTIQYLRQRDMHVAHRINPLSIINRLSEGFCDRPTRAKASVLAELCYLQAKQHPLRSELAIKLYTTSLMYAYAYLFDPELGEPPSIYDPRFRLACDFYNRSLAKQVPYIQERRLGPNKAIPIPSLIGDVSYELTFTELAWEPKEYEKFITAYQFQVEGIRNQFRTSGLGVPLIALRKTPEPDQKTPQDRFLPNAPYQVYPATVLARLENSICRPIPNDKARKVQIALYDPMITNSTTINQQNIDLETDLTTPLAYFLDHAPTVSGIEGFFDVEELQEQRGLYMLHPYQPGKIPVVLVHGLISSPITWLTMLNDLMGDEQLREKYQFWLFLYPTGNPILYSAYVLRESLRDAQQVFDPENNDPAFNQMVLVGHSMGGILSRLMIQDSGDHLWQALSDRPLKEFPINQKEKDFLEEVLFFESVPFVKRAIFIAAPHRGSGLADKWFASWASSTVKLPIEILKAGGDLIGALVQGGPNKAKALYERVPTSVEGLSPDSPLSKSIADMPINPSVPYHSIIGNYKAADTPGDSDKVVAYESAHLDGAVSEKIVKAAHTGAHKHPLAIREVRRILLEHVAQVDSAQ